MRSLISLYNAVSPSVVEDGLLWYTEANAFCQSLADKHGKPLEVVCAVMSALSPGTNYEANKKETAAMIAGMPVAYTTYRANVSKARVILKGSLLPGDAFSLKTGPKTYNFYRNLLNPACPHHVTIDRHAYNLAMTDDYKGLKKRPYLKIAGGYIRAANRLSILPCQLQAVLWLNYRIKQNISFVKFDNVEVPF